MEIDLDAPYTAHCSDETCRLLPDVLKIQVQDDGILQHSCWYLRWWESSFIVLEVLEGHMRSALDCRVAPERFLNVVDGLVNTFHILTWVLKDGGWCIGRFRIFSCTFPVCTGWWCLIFVFDFCSTFPSLSRLLRRTTEVSRMVLGCSPDASQMRTFRCMSIMLFDTTYRTSQFVAVLSFPAVSSLTAIFPLLLPSFRIGSS